MRQPIRSQPLYETPVRWDLPCRTNSDYVEELSFQHGASRLDLTDHTFAIEIRSAVNGAVLKTLSTVSLATAEGIYPVEPQNGFIQIRIHYESLKSIHNSLYPDYVEGGDISLPYDFLVTLPNGDKEAWLSGYVNLDKGITNG